MADTLHSIRDGVAELLLSVPAEVLFHAYASKRAIEEADPPPPLPWEVRDLTIADHAYRMATWQRSVGIDEDVIYGDLSGKLLQLGYPKAEADQILIDAGIQWHLRSDEERLVAVAQGMLEGGFSSEQVRHAIEEMA